MLRVGVIGVGSMGQNHVRVYSEIADLIGVHDAVKDQSVKVAQRFNIGSFDSLDDLLDRVDAVSICTPTSFHYEMAMKVIRRGRSLLVEKPFTGDSKKAEELTKAAEKEGVTLYSGFIERFNPVVSVAKEAIDKGRFGRVISLASRRVSSFPSRIRDVGVIMDLGIHDIDVIRYVTASEFRSVYALGGRYQGTGFEDYANLLLEMEDGAVAFVEVNWLTPMKVRKMSFTCSTGFVQLDYTDQSLEISTTRIPELDPGDMFRILIEHDVRRISVRKEEPLKKELENFLAASEGHSRPFVGGEDAVANLKVCEAAQESLRSGTKVPL
ncbi:MAG: Gfo/Idh/MocA family oxidoreductase [Methanomassiliicoccales archaeon]|nr:MAG: Gfo/Idh/MocA family oxidoreductase [Methanomassiliicoccales archaeon]